MEKVQETVVISLDKYTKLIQEKAILEETLKNIVKAAHKEVKEEKVNKYKIEKMDKEQCEKVLTDERLIDGYIYKYGFSMLAEKYYGIVTKEELEDYAKSVAMKLVKERYEELKGEEDEDN